MLDIVKRTALGTLLLLIMPLAVWFSGWQWQPGSNGAWLRILFWITQTVTRPWGMVTSTLLGGVFLWYLRFRLKPAIFLLVIMIAVILVGQYTKSFIKDWVQEPRPYVVWLEKTHHIDDKTFYQLKRKARKAEVERLLADDSQLPGWLKWHWARETGFAFPSGHTLFAASWALLAVGLLWPRRHIKTVVVLMLWATAVMISRMLLGMHWPQDLMVSTLISGVLVTLATWLAQWICGPLIRQTNEPEVRTPTMDKS